MIGDDLATALPEWRAHAESLMRDEGVITRGGGEPTFSPDTGLLTPAAGTTIYDGRLRIRQPTAAEADVLFGDQPVTRTRFILCLPYTATGIRIGDTLTITVTADPDLLPPRRFQIQAVPMASDVAYKAFPCELVE